MFKQPIRTRVETKQVIECVVKDTDNKTLHKNCC